MKKLPLLLAVIDYEIEAQENLATKVKQVMNVRLGFKARYPLFGASLLNQFARSLSIALASQ